MLVCRIPQAVTHRVRPAAAGRQRRGGPELSGVFVADEDRLAGGIAYRIVSPGGQAIVVAVLRPRIAGAALGGDKSKRRMGNDVRPGVGRAAILVDRDDVLAAVIGKPAAAVE